MNRLGIIQTIIMDRRDVLHVGVDARCRPVRRSAPHGVHDVRDHPDAVVWMPYYVVMAIGGTILFIGVILMFYNVIALMRAPKGDEKTAAEFPIAEASEESGRRRDGWSAGEYGWSRRGAGPVCVHDSVCRHAAGSGSRVEALGDVVRELEIAATFNARPAVRRGGRFFAS